MKCLKALGLAAVAAMALTAFLGANSASATVLCTTAASPCGTSWHVDELDASVAAGQSVTLRNTSGSIEATCTVATAKTTKVATGSSSTTPVGKVEKAELTWGPVNNGCTNKTETVAGGELEVHQIAGTHNGTVTATGFEVAVVLAGVNCTFGLEGTKDIGVLKGGAPAIMEVAVVVVKKAGSFLCPSTGGWEGNYTITNHTSTYVVES
jgi:hypothetical protein